MTVIDRSVFRVALSLCVAATILLQGCSSGNALVPGEKNTKPQYCYLSSAIHGVALQSTCGAGGGGGVLTNQITGAWDFTANSGNTTSTDASTGAVLSTQNGQYPTATTATYQARLNGSDFNIQTIRPDAIQFGMNQLPNGTMYVDGTTHVVTANVIGQDGTHYTITATPDSNVAGYDLEIDASTGQKWSQVVASPGSTTASKAIRTETMCSVATDAEHYFGGVAGVAGGVAFVAGVVGAEPVAVVAGGVAGISAAIGGIGALYAFFVRCK